MPEQLQPTLPGLTVLERGWLSSNNVLLHDDGDPGSPAVLIDSGHCTHAAQTLALVAHALGGRTLGRIVNTHLHSDHCGGNAALQATHGVQTHVPPGQAQAVREWNESALSYAPTRQRCERFAIAGVVQPGSTIELGGQPWQVLAAPGHDPHAVMLFRAGDGVLIAGDALWENGFGVVFPELDGIAAFEEVGEVLDLIERLPVRRVIPGHGAPFTDMPAALGRARSRLASHRADPRKHARHAAKVLIKYHLMEERTQALAEARAWALATPLLASTQARSGQAGPLTDFVDRMLDELLASGALELRDGVLHDR
jgi:glyoxylase-like metal-dependent hydrolase (beta-lactamase superfamily II)